MADQGRGLVVGITGHRPERLGPGVRPWLDAALRAQLVDLAPARVLTGMAQGVDQWVAEICLELGVPYVAVIPCVGQDGRWGAGARADYRRLVQAAADVVVVSPGAYAAWKMHARNRWIVDRCQVLLAVWDGRDEGGTGACVAYARQRGRRVVRIDPGLAPAVAAPGPRRLGAAAGPMRGWR